MDNPKFKVIAELKSDLSQEEQEFVKAKMLEWQEKFELKEIENHTFCKNADKEEYIDFASLVGFYTVLEAKYKKYLSKLEYYDFWDGDFCKVI